MGGKGDNCIQSSRNNGKLETNSTNNWLHDGCDTSKESEKFVLQKQPTMKRDINLPYASCVMIGVIIGSGIFICPVSIVSHTHSIGLSLIIWLLSGLLTISLALCYTELSCMYPKAGGEYAFFKEFLPCGNLAAFLLVWVRFTIITPCFHAILALTTSQYLFKPFFRDCETPFYAVKIFSIWVVGEYLQLCCILSLELFVN